MIQHRPRTKPLPAAGLGRPSHRSLAAALTLVLMTGTSALAQTPLPPDVKQTCTVSNGEISGWFESGSIAPNGAVLPANSLTFTPNSLCSFYKWSAQMFLWLTSPAPSRYGGGSHVFDSPVFYAVSPPNANGQRTLVPNSPGLPINFLPFITQAGSIGQEVVTDNTGKLHNVIHPALGPNNRILLSNRAGQQVEIESIEAAPDGKPVLLDRERKPIEPQAGPAGAPTLLSANGGVINLRPNTVIVNGRPRLITTTGEVVVPPEEGQAGGGGALMSTQNKSLVYYLIQVNDVWGYFLTGMKDLKISNPTPTTFPADGASLGQVESFAQNTPPPNTKPFFPDADAIVVEVKSSWIETANLVNANQYVTITATVPTYNPPLTQANLTQATQDGTKTTQLALVGMHVVGTVLNHPEMIWATFEHINNAPNTSYTYLITNGTKTQPADGPGGWTFSSTGSAGSNNQERMKASGNTITALSGQTIGPSNVGRANPWGTASNDAAFTANNTDLVSINRSVLGQLANGDIRKNYIQTGSTWVLGGQPPSTGTITGTPEMSNTTMETFFQGSNCFDCHSDPPMLGSPTGGGLSHVWGPALPLFN